MVSFFFVIRVSFSLSERYGRVNLREKVLELLSTSFGIYFLVFRVLFIAQDTETEKENGGFRVSDVQEVISEC